MTLIRLPSTALYTRSYDTDEVRAGMGAGIFGSVEGLRQIAEQTLRTEIDKVLADPELQTATTTKEVPVATLPASPSVAERLQQLDDLREQGLVSEPEYNKKRQEILDQL